MAAGVPGLARVGSSSELATVLDVEMLCGVGLAIANARTPVALLQERTGREIAERTGWRHLLRYLRSHQVGSFDGGSAIVHFATPTAYAPAEVVRFLNLPDSTNHPSHVLLLNTELIPLVRGPRQARLGLGVEFVLPNGFPREAIVEPGWARELA